MPLVFKGYICCRGNLLCCCVQGRTALHHAACEANHVIVSMLLDHGADLHARDNQARQKLMKYTKLTAVLWLFGCVCSIPLLFRHFPVGCVVQGRSALDLAMETPRMFKQQTVKLLQKLHNDPYQVRHLVCSRPNLSTFASATLASSAS